MRLIIFLIPGHAGEAAVQHPQPAAGEHVRVPGQGAAQQRLLGGPGGGRRDGDGASHGTFTTRETGVGCGTSDPLLPAVLFGRKFVVDMYRLTRSLYTGSIFRSRDD